MDRRSFLKNGSIVGSRGIDRSIENICAIFFNAKKWIKH